MKALLIASLMASASMLALAAPSGTYGVACTNDANIACQVKYGSSNVDVAGYDNVGYLSYEDNLFSNGWDNVTLNMYPESASSLNQAYYGMGYAEGYATYLRIYQNYMNVQSEFANFVADPAVANWFADNMAWVNKVTAKHPTVPYFAKVANIIQQVKGLAAGYVAGCNADSSSTAAMCAAIDETTMFYINWQAECGDVYTAYNPESELAKAWLSPENQHCSALVKPVDGDLFMSHVAWTGFSWMMRQYKTYNFEDKSFVTLAGHPGMVHSMDDWYMTGRGLATTETTLIVNNPQLYVDHIKGNNATVPSFIRAMVANYLADTTAEWMDLFSTLQSGTYNNQWISVDMKLYTGSASNLPDGLVGVIETLPGSFVSGDVTDFIRTNGHWPSYNFAYYPEIQKLANYAGEIAQFGEGMSYNGYNRARIFARDANKVTDLSSMEAMMTYNDYLNDPLSIIPNCTGAINNTCNPTHSAMLTISSRGDLNPAGNVSEYGIMVSMVGRRNHAGIDVKIASWTGMMKNGGAFSAQIKNGPTTSHNLPVFRFSTSPYWNIPHDGMPDAYDFPINNFTTYPRVVPTPAPAVYDNTGMGTALLTVSGVIIGFAIVMLIVCKIMPKNYATNRYTQV